MRTIETALKMVELRKKQLRDAEDGVVTAVANTFMVCRKCGRRTRIRELTLIQTHWYEAPYGCTGGDTWHQGERQVQCLKCGFVNRDYSDKRLQSQTKYPNAFARIENVHRI
jgi:hypothetical protein